MADFYSKIKSRISCFFIDFQTGRQKLGIILNNKVFKKIAVVKKCSNQILKIQMLYSLKIESQNYPYFDVPFDMKVSQIRTSLF